MGRENQRRRISSLGRNRGERRTDELRPAFNEQRMIMPPLAVADLRGGATKLGARIGDVFLIALPARFGAVGGEDKSEGALDAIVRHLFQSLAEKRTGVAHADVDGKLIVQD